MTDLEKKYFELGVALADLMVRRKDILLAAPVELTCAEPERVEKVIKEINSMDFYSLGMTLINVIDDTCNALGDDGLRNFYAGILNQEEEKTE